jgi:hypothetical protein
MINKPQKVSGVNTVDAPAAATSGDKYFLAWTTSDRSIYWTSCAAKNNQNSFDWDKAEKIKDAASSDGPALAYFAGKLLMAWKGADKDTRIFTSSLTGSTWSAGVPIAGISTTAAPALAVTDEELYLAWKDEHGNTIQSSKSSDGKTWSKQEAVPDAASSDSPALASFKGIVHLAWKGASDTAIRLAKYSPGKGWEKDEPRFMDPKAKTDFKTSKGPALAYSHNGDLYLAWRDAAKNHVWHIRLASGKTEWYSPAKLVAVESDFRPVLAPQTSADDEVLLAWKNAGNTDLFAAPLVKLWNLYPLVQVFTDPQITLTFPALTPPASASGAAHNIGFGGGANGAGVAMSLVLTCDGKATFSGWYQDRGSIPIFDAPAQDYHAAVVVVSSNGVAFTFCHSKNDVPTGGNIDTWDITQKNAELAKNWVHLQPKQGQHAIQAIAHCSCSNTSDLGSFLNSIIADIKSLVGDIEEVVEVVSVISSLAA